MKLEIEITRQDYSDFSFYHFKKKNLVRTSLIGLAGLVILQYSMNKDKSTLSITAILISSILYIIIFSIIIYFSLARSKSIPKENGSFLGKKCYETSDDYIAYKDKDSEGHFQWQAIKSLEESDKAFYLYVDTIMAIIIPKRYLGDKTEQQAFRSFVKSKLILTGASA